MDGESFDRLSVEIHRLRERVTRRGALGALLGGVAAVALGAGAEDADARRRRRKKKCRNFGGRCDHNGDCCGNSRCRNGFCFPRGNGGGGGGGGCCRGFPSSYRCCRFNGIDFCVQWNHPYCLDNGFCPAGWDTCGWNNSVRTCCAPGTRCCDNDRCVNDGFDCDFPFDDSVAADSASRDNVVSEPVPVTEIDPAEFE